MRHLRLFFVMSWTICLFLTGCAHKTASSETTETTMTADHPLRPPMIDERPLSSDPNGSDSGSVNGLFSVNFAFNSSSISPASVALLKKNVDWLKKNPQQILMLEGYCDRHGSQEYNLALGQRRADRVREYLENLGVEASRLTTISYGSEKFLDSGDSEAADSRNRRVNFVPSTAMEHKAMR